MMPHVQITEKGQTVGIHVAEIAGYPVQCLPQRCVQAPSDALRLAVDRWRIVPI